MFVVENSRGQRAYRPLIISLLMLSVAALVVTVWVMIDFLNEQQVVRELIRRLPPDAAPEAEDLLSELRWQFRLTTLVVLNLIGTGVAVVMLWRAYWSSQQSLRDVQVLAADILNSMDQAVITTDREGIVTSVNRQAVDLLTMDQNPIGSRLEQWSNLFDLESFRRESTSADPTRQTRQCVVPHEGGVRTYFAMCQPLRNDSDSQLGVVLQISDETSRVLMEEQMRRMERFMGLGSLAAGLHHEIKNPLTALSLHVQLLEENIDGRGSIEESREMLGVIKTEVTRIAGVLESFRSYASLDRLEHSIVDISEMLMGLIRLMEPQASATKIAMVVDIDSSLPRLRVDRLRIEQVVLNLMLNAIEAMPRGGTMRFIATVAKDRVQISVSDTGKGVPENVRPRIFDPYFTTKSAGTGMGLAFCEKVVRQHHGSLQLKATEANVDPTLGATFVISLPIKFSTSLEATGVPS